jgi:hypothetical protein
MVRFSAPLYCRLSDCTGNVCKDKHSSFLTQPDLAYENLIQRHDTQHIGHSAEMTFIITTLSIDCCYAECCD